MSRIDSHCHKPKRKPPVETTRSLNDLRIVISRIAILEMEGGHEKELEKLWEQKRRLRSDFNEHNE